MEKKFNFLIECKTLQQVKSKQTFQNVEQQSRAELSRVKIMEKTLAAKHFGSRCT
jgi:hypothetical protein